MKKHSLTAIIPNYNYASYLQKRFDSILNQTVLPDEIIFLDDTSSDESIAIAESYLKNVSIPYRIIINKKNSGSVYKQWQKGLEQSRTDLIWIAEADDVAHKRFLEYLVPCFSDSQMGLAYCETAIINPNNRVVDWNMYSRLHNEIDPNKWRSNHRGNGIHEISNYLAIRNTIPNVSAVIFRKETVENMGGFAQNLKLSGDWLSYIQLLEDADLQFIPKKLNYKRVHNDSVTSNLNYSILQIEEAIYIFKYCLKRFTISDRVKKSFFYTICSWVSQSRDSAVIYKDIFEELSAMISLSGDLEKLWEISVKNRPIFDRSISKKIRNFSLEKFFSKCIPFYV